MANKPGEFMTHFQTLGGGEPLRAILRDFYDRVFADVMIGYLFAGSDKERLIELEFQFTARMLGEQVPYDGRAMRPAHSQHRILMGQFNRRYHLLDLVLRAHEVPESVRTAWLSHTRALRKAVVGGVPDDGGCDTPMEGVISGVTKH